MADWTDLINTTLEHRRKGAVEALGRNRPFFVMLKKKSGVETGHGGRDFRWLLHIDDIPLQTFQPGDEFSYERHVQHVEAVLPWRQYVLTDALLKDDFLKNKGVDAIVSLFAGKQKLLEKSFMRQFPAEVLTRDGNAAGSTDRIHGIPSWMGWDSSHMADNKRVYPDDTYAGLSTEYGAVGGGTADTDDQAHVFSPTLVNYTGTGWTDSDGTAIAAPSWANTCLQAMRFGITQCRARNNNASRVDTILMTADMFNAVQNRLQDEERLPVSRGAADSALVKAGMDEIYWDRVALTWDEDMPANTGFGLTMEDMSLMSLQPDLVSTESHQRPENQSFRWTLDFYGNLRCDTPRRSFKLYPYGAAE